jgi:hypothetical protein
LAIHFPFRVWGDFLAAQERRFARNRRMDDRAWTG